MTNRKLLGATALQTGALILVATAAPAAAQTTAASGADNTAVAVPAAATAETEARPNATANHIFSALPP